MPVINRDLASADLWERSLERSQRRRALADSARKEISRRKTATYAVSAAVAASPMWPGISSAVNQLSGKDVSKLAHKLDDRHVQRTLLESGDEGPAVKALQKKLEIPQDGVFGEQTRAAVRDFQKRVGLDTTGQVDVKTWLKLFPNDMVVFAPPGTARALGAKDATAPQWTAVDASQVEAAAAPRRAEHKGTGRTKRSHARDALVHAASLPGLGGVQGDVPATGDVPVPDPGIVPPVVPGVPGGPDQTPATPPSGGHGGVLAPNGNAPSPGEPQANFPVPGGSVGEILKTLMSTADRIDKKGYAYSWGGGHNMAFSGPYDCSGAVSAVLHAAGLLKRPMVSGEFMHWGAPGPGQVTIYANAGHVYMSILGKFFGTSGANPGGGAGWFKGGARPGFAVVHVPFTQMHLRDVAAEKRKKAKILAKKRRAAAKKRRAARQQADRTPYNGPSGGAQAGAPSSNAQPPADQGQPAQQPAPAPAPAPVVPPAAPAPAPVTVQSPAQQQAPVQQQAPAQRAPAQSAPQQSAPAQQAPAQQAPAQQAPAQSAPQQSAPAAPQAPAQPVQQAPVQQAPSPQAPAQPAPQQSAPAAPQAPAQPAPQQSTPAPQAPTPPVQSAPAGDTPGAQPSTPPATAPKPGGGDSAGGNSGAAASG